MISKETLSKMSLEQLEGKLSEVKANFQRSAQTLTKAREDQILKAKVVKGKSSKRKKELITQIRNIEKQTERLNAQIKRIKRGATIKFDNEIARAAKKVRDRALELKTTGAYQTTLTSYEKVLAWCRDMGVDKETLDKLLETYSIEDLANMSGDDFYDEANAIIYSAEIQERLEWEAPSVESIMF